MRQRPALSWLIETVITLPAATGRGICVSAAGRISHHANQRTGFVDDGSYVSCTPAWMSEGSDAELPSMPTHSAVAVRVAAAVRVGTSKVPATAVNGPPA